MLQPPAPRSPDLSALRDRADVVALMAVCAAGLLTGNLLCVEVDVPAAAVAYGGCILAGLSLLYISLRYNDLLSWQRLSLLVMVLAIPLAAAGVAAEVGRKHWTLGWSAHPQAGGWIIVITASLGLLLALAYAFENLLFRSRMSLGGWLALFVAHTCGMTVVTRYFEWRAGFSVAARDERFSWNLVLLALALAALAARGAVAANRAARWLPGWAIGTLAARGHRMREQASVHSIPLEKGWMREAVPCGPVIFLYALSPLAWWLLGLTLTGGWIAGSTSAADVVTLVAVGAILLLRTGLGLLSAARAWRAARKAPLAGEAYARGDSRRQLWGNGLPVAGLLGFYALGLSAHRVQQETLARVLQASEAGYIAELRAMQPPPVSDAQNAALEYAKAEAALQLSTDYDIFFDAWRSPKALHWIRAAQPTSKHLAAATELERCAVFPEVIIRRHAVHSLRGP
ncbi:MAG: hypothetical protein M5U26_12525 [Planctomycetota bacterium]|nr:hypothetical protein [Planctomycetota bacterium]